MAVYCIGDIQGCDDAFERLLSHVDFSPSRDTVYLLGDLVNRGPASAQVLRRCRALEGSMLALLGNHDLHLLAVSQGVRKPSRRDTLQEVLQAPDSDDLLDWLRQQPLARHIVHGGQHLLMVHAGVLPEWSVQDTMDHAGEVQACLQGPDMQEFLRAMYGNTPSRWEDTLQGTDRLRVIVNGLTRLRFCTPEGDMDFDSAESASQAPAGLVPWFEVPGRRTADTLVAFGHWSTLGWVDQPALLGLDTGCVWGGCLSAVRFGTTLAERGLCQVGCPQAQRPGP